MIKIRKKHASLSASTLAKIRSPFVRPVKKAKRWKHVIDTKMKDAGETDYEKKKIKVNPRKRELLNTIIHEELHKDHREMKEAQIRKKTKTKEAKLTPRKAIRLLEKFT